MPYVNNYYAGCPPHERRFKPDFLRGASLGFRLERLLKRADVRSMFAK